MVSAAALTWSLVAAALRWSLFTLILISGCWMPLKATPDEYEGREVTQIQFEPAAQPFQYDQLVAMLPVKTGQKLRGEDVRASIQRLYATGEYADIAVDAENGGGGVVLRFLTSPALFVNHVTADGVPEPPNAGQMVVASKLQLGQEYTPGDLRQATESIADLLRRNGFYKAVIEPNAVVLPGTQNVDIDFHVRPGKRAKFGGLNVTGTPERSVSSVMRSTGWKRFRGLLGWHPVSESRVQSGVEGVRAWYINNNRLLATVQLTRLDFDPQRNLLMPTLDIAAGPIVRVKVTGARVSKSNLKSVLPIYQERSVDKDLLVEGNRDLVQYFQSRGYFDASVNFVMDNMTAGQELISYRVERGAKHRLVKLGITGNTFFDVTTIRERMYVEPATLLRFPHGRFSRDYLEHDLTAIRDLYKANGFRDVDVTAREVDDYGGRNAQIALFITIKEGSQTFVNKLTISGVTAEDEQYLRSVLLSTDSQSYSDVNVASDRDNILQYFYNNGFPDAKFAVTAKQVAPYRTDLVYNITPGPRQYVRHVMISGLKTTDPDLVNQRISLQDGDSLSQSRITESQKRLYDLGIFARVNTALQNPEGDEPTRNVLYSIEEARRYSLNAGFGAEIARIGGGVASLNPATNLSSPAGSTGFSPRVSLGISRLNFLGLGHTVSLQTRVSTLQQRALFSYLAPQFEGSENLSLQFTGLFDISRDVRTFSAKREEGAVQLGQKLSRANTVQYRYVFRNVNILGTPLITPELIPLLSQPVRVGMFSSSFIQDRRDDATDPHRGAYTTVDGGVAASAFGSQTGFGRTLTRNAMFHHVSRNLTLARVTYFGNINRFAGLREIPLPERFFSGGSNTHRAFPDNQAGPRDLKTGFPLGGKALLMNTVEMRFPLIGENIGGALFNDIGNVYSSLGNISLRFSQRNLQDFDYAVQAYGFGIRYRTPIGPVRLDLSYSPNPPHFFGFKGTLNDLLLGKGVQTVQQISPFQFHFSLGQAF